MAAPSAASAGVQPGLMHGLRQAPIPVWVGRRALSLSLTLAHLPLSRRVSPTDQFEVHVATQDQRRAWQVLRIAGTERQEDAVYRSETGEACLARVCCRLLQPWLAGHLPVCSDSSCMAGRDGGHGGDVTRLGACLHRRAARTLQAVPAQPARGGRGQDRPDGSGRRPGHDARAHAARAAAAAAARRNRLRQPAAQHSAEVGLQVAAGSSTPTDTAACGNHFARHGRHRRGGPWRCCPRGRKGRSAQRSARLGAHEGLQAATEVLIAWARTCACVGGGGRGGAQPDGVLESCIHIFLCRDVSPCARAPPSPARGCGRAMPFLQPPVTFSLSIWSCNGRSFSRVRCDFHFTPTSLGEPVVP